MSRPAHDAAGLARFLLDEDGFSDFVGALRVRVQSPIKPPFTVCYRQCSQIASENDWRVPTLSHARRLLAKGNA